jgi:hypothetical protein
MKVLATGAIVTSLPAVWPATVKNDASADLRGSSSDGP